MAVVGGWEVPGEGIDVELGRGCSFRRVALDGWSPLKPWSFTANQGDAFENFGPTASHPAGMSAPQRLPRHHHGCVARGEGPTEHRGLKRKHAHVSWIFYYFSPRFITWFSISRYLRHVLSFAVQTPSWSSHSRIAHREAASILIKRQVFRSGYPINLLLLSNIAMRTLQHPSPIHHHRTSTPRYARHPHVP